MVHALGLGEFQVGRSHECDYPAGIDHLPICTKPRIDIVGSAREIDARVREQLVNAVSVYDVLPDVLEPLAPTHVITQTMCEVCAVSLADVERAMADRFPSRPEVVALAPQCLADVWSDIRRIAAACGIPERADALIASLGARLESISARARASGLAPRVACIEWQEPLMAAGNWVPELIEKLGAVNLFGEAGKHSPWMSFDDLAAADPEVIIQMPCGYSLEKTREEMYWLTQNPLWSSLTAVRNGQVYLTDGNAYFNRPGPRLVDSLEILAEILFPNHFEPTVEGRAWERFTR